MDYIAIDTNIVRADFRMTGTQFRILLDGVGRVASTRLVLPQVVIEEIVALYDEHLRELLERREKTDRDLTRHLGREPEARNTPDLARECASYREHVLERLAGVQGLVLPIPEIPHDVVLKRELSRRKPFKKGGAGYRDFLIWECALTAIRGEADSRLLLVSQNTSDFGPGPSVHGDLLADLQQHGIGSERVRLYTSLEALNAELFVPRLRELDAIHDQILAGSYAPLDMQKWLEAELPTTIHELDDDLGRVCTGIQPGHAFLRTSLKSIQDWNVKDVRALQSGDVLINASCRALVSMDVLFDWADYLRHKDLRDFAGEGLIRASDLAKGGHTPPFECEVEEPVTVDFSIILEAKTNRELMSEVHKISGNATEITFR